MMATVTEHAWTRGRVGAWMELAYVPKCPFAEYESPTSSTKLQLLFCQGCRQQVARVLWSNVA